MVKNEQIQVATDMQGIGDALFAFAEAKRFEARMIDVYPEFTAQERLCASALWVLQEFPPESLTGVLMTAMMRAWDDPKEDDKLKERMRARGLRVVANDAGEALQD